MAAQLPRPTNKKCARCPRPAVGYRCTACVDKARAASRADYKRRLRVGQCVSCSDRATAGIFCTDHWFKNIGVPHKLTIKNGGISMLKEIWQAQDGRCAVTGVQLRPGIDASLDHIAPLAKGGATVRPNLRWVTLTVNHMKWDLSDEEFVSMCKLIAERSVKKPENKAASAAVSRSN